MTKQYDLLVLGTGGAGYSVAIEFGVTTKQLMTLIFTLPTASDDMRSMF